MILHSRARKFAINWNKDKFNRFIDLLTRSIRLKISKLDPTKRSKWSSFLNNKLIYIHVLKTCAINNDELNQAYPLIDLSTFRIIPSQIK